MRHASVVELLVYPYFYGENPPEAKIKGWIYSAKMLPKDGIFVVVSNPSAPDLIKTEQLIKNNFQPLLRNKCILVSGSELNKLPRLISKSGFRISSKSKWYDFGMHRWQCPTSIAETVIDIIFGLKNVRSQHITSKSVRSKINRDRAKREIARILYTRAAMRLRKPP